MRGSRFLEIGTLVFEGLDTQLRATIQLRYAIILQTPSKDLQVLEVVFAGGWTQFKHLSAHIVTIDVSHIQLEHFADDVGSFESCVVGVDDQGTRNPQNR